MDNSVVLVESEDVYGLQRIMDKHVGSGLLMTKVDT